MFGFQLYVSIYQSPLHTAIDTQDDLDQFQKIVENNETEFAT